MSQVQLQAPPDPATPPAADPILGKFKTTEDLAKAYTELEKKLGTQTPATPPTPAAPATSIPAAAGLEIEKYQQEFATSGKLSDESYAALEKSGVKRQIVDGYIAGQQASAAQAESEVLSVVGGRENYDKIVQWATTSLTPAEREAYNTAINSADRNQVKLAVEGLKNRHAAAFGTDPKLVGGNVNNRTPGFASSREMIEAMQDPRYKKDESYRKTVHERVAAMA